MGPKEHYRLCGRKGRLPSIVSPLTWRERTAGHERKDRQGEDPRAGRAAGQGRADRGGHRRVQEAPLRRRARPQHQQHHRGPLRSSSAGRRRRSGRFRPSPATTNPESYYSQALAIYKKISKIDPENVIMIVRLGDLLISQGFTAEARREYLKAEQTLRREKRVKELMFLYDKLIKLEQGQHRLQADPGRALRAGRVHR